MIKMLSFGAAFHKIQYQDTVQAKKLMTEMAANLKKADITSAAEKNQTTAKNLRNAYETEIFMRNLKAESKPPVANTTDVINTYKNQPKKQGAKSKINIRL